MNKDFISKCVGCRMLKDFKLKNKKYWNEMSLHRQNISIQMALTGKLCLFFLFFFCLCVKWFLISFTSQRCPSIVTTDIHHCNNKYDLIIFFLCMFSSLRFCYLSFFERNNLIQRGCNKLISKKGKSGNIYIKKNSNNPRKYHGFHKHIKQHCVQ